MGAGEEGHSSRGCVIEPIKLMVNDIPTHICRGYTIRTRGVTDRNRCKRHSSNHRRNSSIINTYSVGSYACSVHQVRDFYNVVSYSKTTDRCKWRTGKIFHDFHSLKIPVIGIVVFASICYSSKYTSVFLRVDTYS